MYPTYYLQKNGKASEEYKIYRGLNDHNDLGRIISYNRSTSFPYWVNDLVVNQDGEQVEQVSVCNMINGTDSGIYAPLLDSSQHIYAINTDICR